MRSKITDALTVKCPACDRPIGWKCRNWNDVNCAPHRQRIALANGKPAEDEPKAAEPETPSLFQ